MFRRKGIPVLVGCSALFLSGFVVTRAQDQQLPVEHPDCTYFSPQRERFIPEGTIPTGRGHKLTAATRQVAAMLPAVPGGRRRNPHLMRDQFAADSIDSYIFADLDKHSIVPAPATTDWEFIRRVTLDLTGRIPTAARVLAFVADTAPDKRVRADRRTAGQARVGRQMDHVLRRSLSEYGHQAEHLPAPLPARSQCVLPVDPRFAGGQQAIQPDGDRADLDRHRRTATPTAPPTTF